MEVSELEKLLKVRDSQIARLKDELAELDQLVYEYETNDAVILISDTEKMMLNIISEQIKLIADKSKAGQLEMQDTKIFDTLVKDIVAIRGKIPTKGIQKDSQGEATEAELIALVKGD